MGELEDPRRERLYRPAVDDAAVDRAGHDVGKSTLAESWGSGATSSGAEPEACRASMDVARRHVARLRAAHASGDHAASCEAAQQLRVVLETARAAASDDQRAAVDALAAEAAPLLAAAFAPSRDAIDEALFGEGREHWDRDVAAWRAAAAPIAAQLGIDAPIHVDDAAAAHGARGLAHAGAVHLAPTLSPTHDDGLHVLAHELVHVAQSRLPVVGSLADAEREADELAAALVRGALPHQPRIGIAADVAIADIGAKTAAASSTDAAVLFDRALEDARREIVALDLALTALDHTAADTSAAALHAALERADRQLEMCSALDADGRRPELLAMRGRATPLLGPSRPSSSHVVRAVGVTPSDVELGRVEVGGVGSPVAVIFFNKSDETVEVAGVKVLAAPAQPTPDPGEFDVKGAVPATLPAQAVAQLDLAFRPTQAHEIVADLTLTGRAPSGRVERRARLRGTGVKAVLAHRDDNEVAIARRDSLDVSSIPRHPRLYTEMLTVVLAAERLTNEPDRRGESAPRRRLARSRHVSTS